MLSSSVSKVLATIVLTGVCCSYYYSSSIIQILNEFYCVVVNCYECD